MHLLAVQRHAIHVMCEKGLIDHEEAGEDVLQTAIQITILD